MMRNPRLYLLALAPALFLLPGCTPAAHNAAASPATQAAEEPLEYIYALQLARRWQLVQQCSYPYAYLTGADATTDEMGLTLTTPSQGTYRCLYKDTPNPTVTRNPTVNRKGLQFNCGGTPILVQHLHSAEELKTLARAWKTVAAGIPEHSPERAAAFEALAASYRADPAAHVLTEETRALKVQAETEVREKRNFHAVQRFREALDLSPWWPQGRFNLALIYSELNLYHLATIEMEKYLKLAPDAPNARAAQDKIYAWRSKLAR